MRSDDNLGVFFFFIFFSDPSASPTQPGAGRAPSRCFVRGKLWFVCPTPVRTPNPCYGLLPLHVFCSPPTRAGNANEALCYRSRGQRRLAASDRRHRHGDRNRDGTGTGWDEGLHFGHPPPSLPRVAAYTQKAHLFYPILSWVVAIREQ